MCFSFENLLKKGGEKANNRPAHVDIVWSHYLSINLQKAHIAVSDGIGLKSEINYSSHNYSVISYKSKFQSLTIWKEIWDFLCFHLINYNPFHMHDNKLSLLQNVLESPTHIARVQMNMLQLIREKKEI